MTRKTNIRTVISRVKNKQAVSVSDAVRLGGRVNDLNTDQLKKLVSTMASASNKRIKRLAQAGQPIEDTVDRFSVAGKNRNQLLSEYARAKQFLNTENLSLSGQRKIRQESNKRLAEKLNQKADTFFNDKDKYDTFWRTYERLAEIDKSVKLPQYKYRLLNDMKQVYKENPEMDVESLTEKMRERTDYIYQTLQEETETDDIFTIEEDEEAE